MAEYTNPFANLKVGIDGPSSAAPVSNDGNGVTGGFSLLGDSSINSPMSSLNQSPANRSTTGDTGMTKPETNIAGSAIGAAAGVTTTAIGAGFQSAERDRAAQSSRQWADMERGDNLAQENIDKKVRREAEIQKEQSILLQKREYENDYKFKTFMDELNKRMKKREYISSKLNNMFNETEDKQTVFNMMKKSWAGV